MFTIEIDFNGLERLQRELVVADQAIEDMGIFVPAVAETVDFFRARGSEVSPYLTGTLSEAHDSRVEVGSALLTGVVDIDPAAVNPVFGGRPAVYGQPLHRRNPWLDFVVDLYGDQQLNLLAEDIANTIVGVLT